eukprot:GFUD01088151.1.p1 GENE.GFUD01088151.1~~GFUD01088151.1.p1  ORF type:complete len:434 (+),score=64.50 GFUD01088151.1:63-1364(+)
MLNESVNKEREDEKTDKETEHSVSKYVSGADWGWCMIAACFLCSMVNDIITYFFGISMKSDVTASVSHIPQVGGVFAVAMMLIGPIAAVFVNRCGNQTTSIVGSVIATLAMFVSNCSTSFTSVLATYGLLVGFGLGFVCLPAVVAVGEYCRLRISFATGIFVSVCGAGLFLVVPLLASLLGPFGWQGYNRVMALLCLDCAFFGLVMLPSRRKKHEETDNHDNEEERKEEYHLNLLCDFPFILLILANFLNAMATYISYSYLPSIASQSSLSSADASFFIYVVGVSNTVGRIISGWLSDFKCTNAQGVTTITGATACVLTYLLPSDQPYWCMLLLTTVFGFIISSGPTLCIPLIMDLIGIHQLNTVFGILIFARGVAALLGPSIVGIILVHWTPNLSLSFYMASFLFGVSTFIQILIFCFSKKVHARRAVYSVL